MGIRRAWFLVVLVLLAACTSIKTRDLPKGITYLKGIDPRGLKSPVWSPDGNKIVASYDIYPAGDIFLPFGRPPIHRHEIIIIDTATWKSTTLVSEATGGINAQAWSLDSNQLVFYWGDHTEGCMIFEIELDRPQPTCLYPGGYGVVSPDLKRIAVLDDYLYYSDHSLTITDLRSNKSQKFDMPFSGRWSISSWSPDLEQISLTYERSENDTSEDIFLLSLSSGVFERFTNDEYYNGPALFSPNGRLIMIAKWKFTEPGRDEKWIISTLDHKCEWTISTNKWFNYAAWSPDSEMLFLIDQGDGAYLADLKVLFGSDFPNSCPAGK